VYADDALCVSDMNKGTGGQQPLLRDGWYHDGDSLVVQKMYYEEYLIQQQGLFGKPLKEFSGSWRSESCGRVGGIFYLSAIHRVATNVRKGKSARTVPKAQDVTLADKKKVHSSNCTSTKICDSCVRRKESCRCVPKLPAKSGGKRVARNAIATTGLRENVPNARAPRQYWGASTVAKGNGLILARGCGMALVSGRS
jgi:hypothetical protein